MSLKKSHISSVRPAVDQIFAKARFDNSYSKLPERFYAHFDPVPVRNPALFKFNRPLAERLGLDTEMLTPELAAQIFSGNHVPSQAMPVAMAYAGHQFGYFVPQLGDGRAVLLGEIIDIYDHRYDIHLKGSGQTPFSRGADGRSPLGPVIREYIVSEAMQALGVPTTRSLAAVTTGEIVQRGTPLPGAVLTRVAASHVRVGTFEYFAARKDEEAVRQLANYVIVRLYPEIQKKENPFLALLESVMDKQIKLVADWMLIGFVHGVMNTDNMAVSGETIDYGPCAFIDSYDPAAVFSSIDVMGRYAYNNQGYIACWNLVRFAETLLPLFDENTDKAVEKAESVLSHFPERFENAWLEGMRRKLGLQGRQEGDKELINSFLSLMQTQSADFTLTFRALCAAAEGQDTLALQALLGNNVPFNDWLGRWRARLEQQKLRFSELGTAMRAVNPAYIPRNHRIEQAISLAVKEGDFSRMDMLLDVLSKPYEERKEYEAYALPPKPEERVLKTFCGT